jgi:hypothetical protein
LQKLAQKRKAKKNFPQNFRKNSKTNTFVSTPVGRSKRAAVHVGRDVPQVGNDDGVELVL